MSNAKKQRSIIRWFNLPCFLLLTSLAYGQTSTFEQMLNELLEGSVPMINTGALEKKLAEPLAPILLDAREPDEYAVSHLKGAKNVGYKKFDLKSLSGIDKDAPIVVYCSVGYRSEKIGEKLQKAGFSNVVNLRGGIFDWANQRRPLVNKQQKMVTDVHPYNRSWGKWLTPEKSKEPVLNP